MTVTKDKRFIVASLVMSTAFFLFANGLTAGAQEGTSFSLDTARTTQRSYHPERGEVLLRELVFGAARATLPKLRLDPHLSILVTDVDTTREIKFSEVMDQLVRQGGDPTLTKLDLFRQWWDTAGQGWDMAGQRRGLGLGPHCDDESTPQGDRNNYKAISTRNGFPYRCPRREQEEASSDPFTNESVVPEGYSAIAFSNRFDLIGADVPDPKRPWRMLTPDCGEYRIVFARNSGKPKDSINGAASSKNRNLINFEARVPNPEPANGVKGCRPILDFWHGLSDKSIGASERGKLLHDFYLKGLPSHRVGPVVDIAHYTFGTGQIRTNQFLHNDIDSPGSHPFDWTLREFKAVVGSDGRLRIVPDTVKTSPGNGLFRSGSVDPRVASLTLNIRAQIGRLLGQAAGPEGVRDINSIGFSISGTVENAFEGDECDGDLGDVSAAFLGDFVNGKMPNAALSASIQDALTAAGSPLTPTNIVNRIRTQTCAGCHHYSGNPNFPGISPDDLGGEASWPKKADGDAEHRPMDFTHVSEREDDLQQAIVGNGKRYAISSAVEAFLVYREAFMKKALGLP